MLDRIISERKLDAKAVRPSIQNGGGAENWKYYINNKQSCPYCNNRKTISGINDIFTTHPKLKKEWVWEKK